jgi:formate hydrogenlyase subunit 3/multisubunit Na+/H+ antiporter MnhD subunit
VNVQLLLDPMLRPVLLPLAAGVLCLLLPGRGRLRSAVGVVAAAATVVVAWPLFRAGAAGTLGGGRWLRLDGLAGVVLLFVAAFGLVVAVYSAGFLRGRGRQREYWAYLLWTVGASAGAVLANDLLLLLVLWGFLGTTLWLMIGLGGPDAAGAAKKSFLIVGATDAAMLLGVVIFRELTGTTRMDAVTLFLQGGAAHAAFLCIVAAALAKAGALPFHTWVPECGAHAPAPVAAFLPASLDKLLGIYLLARCVGDLFVVTEAMRALLMFVGAATIVAAVMVALVQHDLKRLLSYHAVSQVGYMVLGVATGTAVGVAGGLFHMLNHTMYKSGLFLGAGAVERAAGTTDLDRLGGLARRMPRTFGAFLVSALAISGIPPLNGFASKWMVYQGVLEVGRAGGTLWIACLLAAMAGSALTLASFVKVLHAAFLCPPPAELRARDPKEVGWTMWATPAALAAACLAFGVFAYGLPLRHLVAPMVGGPILFAGVWWSGTATLMLGIAIAAGGLGMAVALRGRVRRTPPWIGGQALDSTWVAGVPVGPSRRLEVTGVDFYDTIERLPGIRGVYALARRKLFDLYEGSSAATFYFVGALRRAHTGLLPLYVTWVVVGLLAVLYVLLEGRI